MKKSILIIAPAVFAASMASAVALSWNITGVQYGTDGSTVLANKTVALVMAASSATAGDISYSYDATDGWKITGGQLVTVSTLSSGGKFASALTTQVGSAGWGSGTYEGVGFDGNAYTTTVSQGTGTSNAVKYFTILFDTDYTSGKYAVLSPAAATTVASPTTATGRTTFSSSTGANTTWTSVNVPEPTTVALLALGLAAVGLKRKVA